ncbi:hypothetical protein [Trinickia fusca]|uniref:Glycosyltransferase family 1 protein n=1 Tax=Trinickia fusca TaxID=2419777 RepID=A0A494XTJ6_9BURK|nr:hypothetical protein [Trinickia fusca]RKP50853.1 hypothetical protein D7S89_07210 [Trinickia fusca]
MVKPLTESGLYPTVDDLLGEANARLDADEISDALRLVQQFVTAVNADPRAIARVFADRSLDDFCQALGARVLARMAADNVAEMSEGAAVGPVYLATELYATGGHTAVLEDLLKAGSFGEHPTILLTNVLGTVNLEVIRRRFAAYSVNIECVPDGSLEDRLRWTLTRLRALRPTHLLLFNHHQDSVAIAAAQPSLAAQTIFYHHADHHLCLGVTLPYDLHVDPSPAGYHNCREQLGMRANVYWPLTAEDRGAPGLHRRSLTAGGGLRTCSTGTRNKFEQPYRFQYGDLVPRMLAATQGSHVHIGVLSDSTLECIAEGMRRAGVPAERFTYIEWVPSVWQALQDEAVDVYIGSFPVAGARATVEALGSGTPVIAHQSYLSRFHGATDMLYPQGYSWSTPDELLAHLAALDAQGLQQEALWARARFDQFHTLDALRKTIAAGHDALPSPPLRDYTSDPLQILLDDIGLGVPAERLAAEAGRLQATLQEIHASRSWKLARAISKFVQKVPFAGSL